MGARQGRESTPAITTELILMKWYDANENSNHNCNKNCMMQTRTISLIIIKHSKYILKEEKRNVRNM
jgi:hypothetical protein